MEPREGGCEGRGDRDNTLKLDIDVDVEYYDPATVLRDKLIMLRALGFDYKEAYWEPSPSGRHIHIVIKLDKCYPIETIFYLQFILGDDPKRANLNFYRLKYFPHVAKYFNVLFVKKEKITWRWKVYVLAKKAWARVRYKR